VRTRRSLIAPGVSLAVAALTLVTFSLGSTLASADDSVATDSPTASLTSDSASASASSTPEASALAMEPAAGTERYIVVADPGSLSLARSSVTNAGGDIIATYDKALTGMTADLTAAEAAALAQAPGIDYLEKDQEFSIGTNDTDPAIITDAGCTANTLARGDDVSSAAVPLGFTVNWFGTAYTGIYVNSNGGIAFDDGIIGFTDYSHNIDTTTRPIVLPLGTDTETRGGSQSAVTYGPLVNTLGGRAGYCVNWVGVGAYGYSSPAYSAQLLIMNRGSGNVDLIFNYSNINTTVSAQRIEIGYADPVNRANSLRVTGSAEAPTQFGNTGSRARISSRQDGAGYTSTTGRFVYSIAPAGSPTATPSASPTPTATSTSSCPTSGPAGSQACATWGLDRIDQGTLPLNSLYYAGGTGAGVTAYIVDTGIRSTHVEFTGRMLSGATAISDGQGTNDCNGHGTHVAGTVGGTTYGVAKQVSLVPVRVFGCTGRGSTSDVISGINWAIGNHGSGPAVMNLSLGGSYSKSMNDAIAAAVADGISVEVAAGNDAVDACTASPASEPTALTVAASNITDGFAYFSNFGTCVDLIAPGVDITSAWNTGDTAVATISGTSMATPHVAGAAAAYLSLFPAATPAQVASALLAVTSSNQITSVPDGTPNELLFARDFTSNASHGVASAAPAPPASNGGTSSGGSGGSGGGSDSGGGGGALQVITEVRPAAGPLSGGNRIAIIGYGFTGATRVEIGGVSAPFTVVNDAHVEVTVPAGSKVGPADVAVVLTPARGRAFAPGGYVYQETVVVPVAPTAPGEAGILSSATSASTSLPRVIPSLSRASVRTVGTSTRVSMALSPATAGLQATLMRGTKPVSRTTVSTTGRVSFSMKKLASGSYRIVVIDSAGASSSTKPFSVRATTRA